MVGINYNVGRNGTSSVFELMHLASILESLRCTNKHLEFSPVQEVLLQDIDPARAMRMTPLSKQF